MLKHATVGLVLVCLVAAWAMRLDVVVTLYPAGVLDVPGARAWARSVGMEDFGRGGVDSSEFLLRVAGSVGAFVVYAAYLNVLAFRRRQSPANFERS